MDSSSPKYLIINLNIIFDFSSISFALLKKLEEDKTKDYNFGDVNFVYNSSSTGELVYEIFKSLHVFCNDCFHSPTLFYGQSLKG